MSRGIVLWQVQGLLVEVSDSSFRYDKFVKRPLYARAGITEVWVVDLRRRALHADRLPSGDRFTEDGVHRPGETLGFAAAPDIAVTMDDLLG